ncbi:MAG: tryptophan synthase subunit alpha [Candidatus Saganbacteria bacterium]|nr:tryptophan synthase subunit alpha [Candidatus Saganbacteria bacterium]
MSNLSKTFKRRKTLITYITAGDPSLPATEKLVYELEQAGADIIELGIPFSDPLADGPVIQASHQRALKKNVSLAAVFKLVARVRKTSAVPICFMPAYNLIVKYGEEKFYQDCEKFGVDGVVIPDLPPEESLVTGRGSRVERIAFVAPTSTEERIKRSVGQASGFIYLISVAGITGQRETLGGDLSSLVARIRKHTKLPVAVGFGISTPAQAAALAKVADGVIVGSALVDLIAKKKTGPAVRLAAALRQALDA